MRQAAPLAPVQTPRYSDRLPPTHAPTAAALPPRFLFHHPHFHYPTFQPSPCSTRHAPHSRPVSQTTSHPHAMPLPLTYPHPLRERPQSVNPTPLLHHFLPFPHLVRLLMPLIPRRSHRQRHIPMPPIVIPLRVHRRGALDQPGRVEGGGSLAVPVAAVVEVARQVELTTTLRGKQSKRGG
jgi:hypothetical protein